MEMWCRLAVILVVFGCHLISAEPPVQSRGPCNILDSINITDGHPDQNGNFHHKDVVYRKGTFQSYNYIVENFTNVVKVEPHVRGCICMYKPCIRLCCKDGDTKNPPCVKTPTINVPTQDEEEEIDLSGKKYGVLSGRMCKSMYKLEPTEYDYDRWTFMVSDWNFYST
jgi:hypothetical protein